MQSTTNRSRVLPVETVLGTGVRAWKAHAVPPLGRAGGQPDRENSGPRAVGRAGSSSPAVTSSCGAGGSQRRRASRRARNGDPPPPSRRDPKSERDHGIWPGEGARRPIIPCRRMEAAPCPSQRSSCPASPPRTHAVRNRRWPRGFPAARGGLARPPRTQGMTSRL